MEPIENEPKGWKENQQLNATSFDGQSNKEMEESDIDTTNSGMASNADNNTFEEEQLDSEDEIATDKITNNDPRGFMGDFAEPQHDD